MKNQIRYFIFIKWIPHGLKRVKLENENHRKGTIRKKMWITNFKIEKKLIRGKEKFPDWFIWQQHNKILGLPAYFNLLHIALFVLRRYYVVYKLNVCGNPTLSNFSNSICSLCVPVLQFGNSHNISHFFIIIILAMVICDHWV